ncbi:MAG TPA: hypothetical protein VLU47_11195 [Blastocatellia bacterium]|nr:hypothetical protein [Blastocatellia bacterium]
MKRVLVLVFIVAFASAAAAQTTKRSSAKRNARSSVTYAQKQLAEVRAGRERIASQIKTLTQFLYLLGSISKSIETAEQVNRNREDSSVGMSIERIEQNKAKVRDSIRNVRVGLDQLEASFRNNAALHSSYPNLAGVARIGQTAESEAAANHLDQAGRSLIAVVTRLADALAALR